MDNPDRKQSKLVWIANTFHIMVGLAILAIVAYPMFSPHVPEMLRLSGTEALFAATIAVALIGSTITRMVIMHRRKLAANHAFGTIRIVAIPAGEAPPWVREKWLGLKLPLARKPALQRSDRTAGVLSGPRSCVSALAGLVSGRYEKRRGFTVPVVAALQQLEAAAPEAAAWWRTNTPHLCKPLQLFMFEAEACEIIAQR